MEYDLKVLKINKNKIEQLNELSIYTVKDLVQHYPYRFEEMLAYMEEKYRYVFIDSPPLSLVSDGERIGNLCDGAILVVRGGATSKHLVKNSIRQLERAGCPLLGIVLNRVEGAKSGYYSKRYGSKYYGGKYYNDAYYYGNH